MRRFLFIFSLLGAILLATLPSVRADEAVLVSKLDKLEEKQEQILKELAEIKAELQVVKIRATLKN